jgi:hypothetical protein
MSKVESELYLCDSCTSKASCLVVLPGRAFTDGLRGPAPSREMDNLGTFRSVSPLPASHARADANRTTEPPRSSLPKEAERVSSRVLLRGHGLPPDVLDKLLLIYFTHVHVSLTAGVCSGAHLTEPMANHLQATLHIGYNSATAAQVYALRRCLCGADTRARSVRQRDFVPSCQPKSSKLLGSAANRDCAIDPALESPADGMRGQAERFRIRCPSMYVGAELGAQ